MPDMPGPLDLAVIIVAWNNADVIAPALDSLLRDLADSGLRHDVWLVDAASQDNTVKLVRSGFPEVKLLVCERNVGFAAANNLALRALGFESIACGNCPKAVYLLNPDTVTQAGAARQLYETLMGDSRLGVVGARLTYADGSFQHSAFRFPGLRQVYSELYPAPGRWLDGSFNGRYPREKYLAGAPFAIDFPLGAAMMLKREAIAESGLLDEAFFLYCEEVDWAWRMRKSGWHIACEPRAHVTHIGGQSTGQAGPGSLVHLWRSRLHLMRKHFPRWKRQIARRIIVAGMQRRLRELGAKDAEMAEACREIIEMASR